MCICVLFVACLEITPWQHLRVYQNVHQFVTMHTHGDFTLGDQVTRTRTQFPTQSHYTGNAVISPCPILGMLSAGLSSVKYKLSKYLV